MGIKSKYYSSKSTLRAVLLTFATISICIFLNFLLPEKTIAKGKKPKLQSLDTLPPAPEWELACDGTVNVISKKYVHDKPDVGYRSNLQSIKLDSNLSYNYRLFYTEFDSCYDQSTDWRMEIIDNREDAYAVVTFTDCAGNDTSVYIHYFAINVDITPKIQSYGYLSIGDSTDRMFYVINKSETSQFPLSFLQLKRKDQNNNPQGFAIWDSTGKKPLPSEFGRYGNRPLLIPSLDSFPFIVRFKATEEGEFWDSIGVGDTCNFWYKAEVEAIVGSPTINVTDCEFPNTKINRWNYSSFDVQNTGIAPLLIFDYKGPTLTGIKSKNKIYNSNELNELNISETNPLVIQPNEYMTFNVSFTPDEAKDFLDSIVFISNSVENPDYNNGNDIDSVCILSGKGVVTGLKVNGYDWGRKRIHRPETFPVEPYPAMPDGIQDSAVRLTNEGYYVEGVTRLNNIEETGDISSFKVNRANLITTVSGGKSKVIPVTFQPIVVGEHLLKVKFSTYDVEADSIISTLQGVGVVPRLQFNFCDFGNTQVNDFDNAVTKQITIKNMDYISWQYCDTVTINDLVGENVSDDMSSWRNGIPFRYNKNAINFPIVLQPGDSLAFDVEFVATMPGKNEATLTTKSDAAFDVTSHLTGYDSGTDVEAIYKNEIEIYPNPASDKIHVTGLPEETMQIKILDVMGNEKINYQLLITNYEFEVDVGDLSSGVYFLQVNSSGLNSTRKFSILR